MFRHQSVGVRGKLTEAAPIALRKQDVALLPIGVCSEVRASRRTDREISSGQFLGLFEVPDIQREDSAKLELPVGRDTRRGQ